MIRDTTVTALIQHRMAPKGAVHRDAVRLLLTFCGAGMTDPEIAAELEATAHKMAPELAKEVRAVASSVGISLV